MKQALCWSLAAGVALSLPAMRAMADSPVINFPSAGNAATPTAPATTAPAAPQPVMTPQQRAALDAATTWDRGVAGEASTAPPVTPKPEPLWPQVKDVWPRPPSDEVPIIDRPLVGAAVPAPPPPTVLYGGGRPPEYPPAPPPPEGAYPDYGR